MEPVVTVRFAQPFPSDSPDLKAFSARDQGQYPDVVDSTRRLQVTRTALQNRQVFRGWMPRHEWGSLARAQPDSMARFLANPRLGFRLTAVTPDSVQLSYQEVSTILNLREPKHAHLRHYRGRYYLSQPAPDDSTAWEVRRLTLSKGHFAWERFNPDSLRIRALAPTSVQLRRQAGRLFFTVNPADKKSTHQVHDYAGLWLPE